MKYFDYGFRTNNSTGSAARTVRIVGLGREETVFIGFFRNDDAALRTCHYTQAAAFTSFDININFTDHQDNYAQICLLFIRFVDSNRH